MAQLSLVAEELKSIEFEVRGTPVPQGSKIGMVSGKRNGPWALNPRAVLIESGNKKTKTMPANRLKDWRENIAANAMSVMWGDLWLGEILIECEFVLPRSKSHYTPKGVLRKGARLIPPNDLDKLARAVGDAMSKVVYDDDNQITRSVLSKRYANSLSAVGGVRIKVSQL